MQTISVKSLKKLSICPLFFLLYIDSPKNLLFIKNLNPFLQFRAESKHSNFSTDK